ncbi:TIGR02186 family protein [Sinirhodobacter sp. WL0062]|uniref:TIGR02186 family protein n=1 Tax=Rhodobacter flavimaris TaxID=2907145 RepID=A0ABS8YVB8_9RHOB|nr:TIGR02186 family protein [Sinirhodobacter sp. WL0062]MCE5973648.1 TIGR02186 family protein [Sinirhodobacter sp. WL0062]
MIRWLLLFLAICALPARAEEVVAGLSQDSISITTSFDGSEILIYGAVKRAEPEPEGAQLGVIVTLEGPVGPVTVRRKSREMGIWVNTESVGIGAAPSYYAIATSDRLVWILDPIADVTHRITIPLAVRAFSGPIEVSDARPFTEALLRIREREGLYRLDEGAVKVVENTLFRADFKLPANLIEGDYKTRIFLTRGGQIVDSHRAAIYVRRVGLERWLYVLSQEHAALYGLLSLSLAVLAGWAASEIFRMIRN